MCAPKKCWPRVIQKRHPVLVVNRATNYCRSGNIREVLIFANFAKRTNSRIQESRENYNITTKEKEKFKHTKITRFTVLHVLTLTVLIHFIGR